MNDVPMRKSLIIKVAGPERGQQLIAILAQKLGVSRNAAKRLIDTRGVFVNNQRVWMARHEVDTGDVIEVHGHDDTSGSSVRPIEVLWQDEQYLMINKPSGLLSNGSDSVEQKLARELGREVFAVHRLDRDTSGCMLLAWSKPDMEKMIPVFQKRDVVKVYEGLVIGKWPAQLSVIDRRIEGEDAVTLVKCLRMKGPASRIEFTLVTGRTHQIRRHLACYDLHLAGEKNYGTNMLDNKSLRQIARHMLHAKQLGFPHPLTGKFVQARAGLPNDYKEAAKILGV